MQPFARGPDFGQHDGEGHAVMYWPQLGLREETGLDPWSCNSRQVRLALVKEDKLAVVPRQDQWRLPYLAKLLVERGERYYQCEDTDWLTELIDALCAN